MPKAFAKPLHLAGFALLLAVCLLLPMLLWAAGLPPRHAVYDGISHFAGSFVFTRHYVMVEKDELDIAFIGNSLTRLAIDEPHVHEYFSTRLGRAARSVVFPLTWEGIDYQYYVARDLLENRKVRMLVISLPNRQQLSNRPHVQIYRLVRLGDYPDALAGLSWGRRAALYGAFVLGAPRNLLNLIRPNLPTAYLDGLRSLDSPDRRRPTGFPGKPWVEDLATAPVIAPERMIAGETTPSWFAVGGPPLGDYQAHFARRLIELAARHATQLVVLHLPVLSERGETEVVERADWRALAPGLKVVGVPPAELFRGLSEDRYEHMYQDEHMSINGQRLFTATVTPALWRIYERLAARPAP